MPTFLKLIILIKDPENFSGSFIKMLFIIFKKYNERQPGLAIHPESLFLSCMFHSLKYC